MKVVIASATEKEIEKIKSTINASYSNTKQSLDVSYHITDVGILSSCFSIARLIFEHKPDLIIQAGIAGTFDNNIALGKVVAVRDEILGDTGVEEKGNFNDLFDLKLKQENNPPFVEKRLHNHFLNDLNHLNLEEVTAVTVNEITTYSLRIEQLKVKYQPVIESMEGASLHYCCLLTSTPFIQIRAVSNYIGERDKSKWNFKDALNNLSETVIQYIQHLQTL